MQLQTASDKEKEDSFRHSALEVLVSLCEASPPMMRKSGHRYIAPIGIGLVQL